MYQFYINSGSKIDVNLKDEYGSEVLRSFFKKLQDQTSGQQPVINNCQYANFDKKKRVFKTQLETLPVSIPARDDRYAISYFTESIKIPEKQVTLCAKCSQNN